MAWLIALTWLANGANLRAAQNDACLSCHADASPSLVPGASDAERPAAPAPWMHAEFSCTDCHQEFDAEALPHRDPMQTVDCTVCHADVAESHVFHARVSAAVAADPTANLSCRSCHGTHEIAAVRDPRFRFASPQTNTACGSCHQHELRAYQNSAHHGAEDLRPDCLRCHRASVVNGDRPALELKLAQSRLCLSCHVDDPAAAARTRLNGRFVASWDSSVHGRALERGEAAAANCVDCHGSHEMQRGMVADSRVNKLHLTETCRPCHAAEAEAYAGGTHAVALQHGVKESPACTDCHGEHLILAARDPRSPVAPRNVSQQLCGDCHGSVRLAQKYGISSDRFATFADSFHGLAVRGGAVEVVNCASCHGFHDVLASSDPRSPIHKANLAQTCGQCHPGANERFAVGSVHMSMAPGGAPQPAGGERVIQIVATVYVWAIIVIVGGMLAHNLLDLLKKVRRKIRGHTHAVVPEVLPHRLYLRMTVNERLQHGALVVSFVLLVVTGFMLRFPEAWWVVALRECSDHLFEMRGWLHRAAAVMMVAGGIWHTGYVTLTTRGRELIRALWPRWRDARDMLGVLRYNLGLAGAKPRFGRFSYIEKLEYWALLWGSVIMTLTGVLLWADETTMGLLAKLGFDIARTVHYYEAVLAALSVVVWHFYFVIFNPDVYPMNLSWLTGRMTEEEMTEEHPLELERLQHESRDAEKRGPATP